MEVEDISSDKTPGVINIEIPKSGAEDNQGMALKIGQTHQKASHICIFGDCEKGKRGGSDFCRKHKRRQRSYLERLLAKKRLQR